MQADSYRQRYHGGERLQEDLEMALRREEQREMEEVQRAEQRAFDKTLESNTESFRSML